MSQSKNARQINHSKKCRVLFPYQPVHKDELELKVGQILEIIGEDEDGWLRGISEGKIGVFPSNFVQILSEEKSGRNSQSSRVNELKKSKSQVPNEDDISSLRRFLQTQKSEVDETTNTLQNIEEQELTEDDSWNVLKNSNVSSFKNRYETEQQEEIDLLRKYLQTQKSEEGEKSSSSSHKATLKPYSNRNSTRVTGTQSQTRYTQKSTSTNRNNGLVTTESSKSRKMSEECVVMFPYTAFNEDELTLEKGRTIKIITKDCEDEGWWKGEIDGKTGVFPENFVKIIQQNLNDDNLKKPDPSGARETTKEGTAAHVLSLPFMETPKKLSSASKSNSEKLSVVSKVGSFKKSTTEKTKINEGTDASTGENQLDSNKNVSKGFSTMLSDLKNELGIKKPNSETTSARRNSDESTKSKLTLTNMKRSMSMRKHPGVDNISFKETKMSLIKDVKRRITSPISEKKEKPEVSESKFNQSSRLTDVNRRIPKQMRESKENYDDLVSETKLEHPTANRVKAPKRRPPSQHFLRDSIPDLLEIEFEEEEEDAEKEEPCKSKISQKLLNRSTGAIQVLPCATTQVAKPSWMEELKIKNANRRSGIFADEQNTSLNHKVT